MCAAMLRDGLRAAVLMLVLLPQLLHVHGDVVVFVRLMKVGSISLLNSIKEAIGQKRVSMHLVDWFMQVGCPSPPAPLPPPDHHVFIYGHSVWYDVVGTEPFQRTCMPWSPPGRPVRHIVLLRQPIDWLRSKFAHHFSTAERANVRFIDWVNTNRGSNPIKGLWSTYLHFLPQNMTTVVRDYYKEVFAHNEQLTTIDPVRQMKLMQALDVRYVESFIQTGFIGLVTEYYPESLMLLGLELFDDRTALHYKYAHKTMMRPFSRERNPEERYLFGPNNYTKLKNLMMPVDIVYSMVVKNFLQVCKERGIQ